jgi:hypothetical protein
MGFAITVHDGYIWRLILTRHRQEYLLGKRAISQSCFDRWAHILLFSLRVYRIRSTAKKKKKDVQTRDNKNEAFLAATTCTITDTGDTCTR